jgi:hypothetical protein
MEREGGGRDRQGLKTPGYRKDGGIRPLWGGGGGGAGAGAVLCWCFMPGGACTCACAGVGTDGAGGGGAAAAAAAVGGWMDGWMDGWRVAIPTARTMQSNVGEYVGRDGEAR